MTKRAPGSEGLTVTRDKNGHFLPGSSANPGGRPAIIKEIQTLARSHSDEAIATLVACMKDEDGRVRVAASIALLDRGYGKPAQQLQIESDGVVQNLIVLPAERHDA